jgi:hypothetical protein
VLRPAARPVGSGEMRRGGGSPVAGAAELGGWRGWC